MLLFALAARGDSAQIMRIATYFGATSSRRDDFVASGDQCKVLQFATMLLPANKIDQADLQLRKRRLYAFLYPGPQDLQRNHFPVITSEGGPPVRWKSSKFLC